MENLNKFELAVLHRLAAKYISLQEHLPLLKVLNRKITGVGMYIDLIYYPKDVSIPKLEVNNTSISTNESIEIQGLKYGLGYEVGISVGQVKYIELVTYGEDWDGSISDNFSFASE